MVTSCQRETHDFKGGHAVRATVMRDVHNTRLKKFIVPKSQIDDFKGLLTDMSSDDAEASLFK